MKLGIDCRMFSSRFTGIGRYTYELVNHFIKINENSHKPHEIVLFFNNPEYQKFKPPSDNVKKVLVNSKHYSLAEQTRFLSKLNKEKLDLIHFPHFNIPVFYRRPYTVTIHDLTLSLFPGQKMTKWYHRLAYQFTIKNTVKKAKKIIAVSQSTKDDLIEILKVPSEKIKVIHNGVGPEFIFIQNPEEFKKTLSKYKIKKRFLLYTGVWRDHKNLPRLIKAFEILRQNKKLDLQLIITGKHDPLYPEVIQTVKNLNLEQNVIFPGLVDEKELIHLYNAALFYVFPSLYEGFGLPILESMRCGTPVIASNVSSIPEVCGEDRAILFDPLNINDIAEKIYTLYTNADLQAKLIQRGMEHATKFSWKKMARESYNYLIDEDV